MIQLLAVLLIGPALAAGTIAQERERRTMEYLYTTPLSNLEIIIGKLGGRVLQILYFILSGVPVLALAMLLGGIAPRSIVSLTIITLSTVLFVTMVSMAVSAWTAKARDAVVRAYLVFFCLWVLPLAGPMLSSFNLGYAWMWPLVEQVIIANPVVTFTLILEGQRPWWGVATEPWLLLLALVRNQMLVGGAALRAGDTFHAPHPSAANRANRPASAAGESSSFAAQIGDNPMYWKEMYAEPGSSRLGLLGYGLMALIFVVVCGITYLYVPRLHEVPARLLPYSPQYGESFCEYAIGMGTFLGCCGLLLLTARAAGSITAEKERDCWVSLIGTPLEEREIVTAKILGSLWSLRVLVPFLAVVWLPALTLRPDISIGIAFSLLDLGILAAFTATLGVYCSLSSKSTLRAMAAALGIALVIGGGYMLCCCPMVELGSRGGGDEGLVLGVAPCMPFLLFWPGVAGMTLGGGYHGGPPEREFGSLHGGLPDRHGWLRDRDEHDHGRGHRAIRREEREGPGAIRPFAETADPVVEGVVLQSNMQYNVLS